MSDQKASIQGTALESLYQNIRYPSTWKQPLFTVSQPTHFPSESNTRLIKTPVTFKQLTK